MKLVTVARWVISMTMAVKAITRMTRGVDPVVEVSESNADKIVNLFF
jgi:hypothetical protein